MYGAVPECTTFEPNNLFYGGKIGFIGVPEAPDNKTHFIGELYTAFYRYVNP